MPSLPVKQIPHKLDITLFLVLKSVIQYSACGYFWRKQTEDGHAIDSKKTLSMVMEIEHDCYGSFVEF